MIPAVPSAPERFLRLNRNEQVRKRRRAQVFLRFAAGTGVYLVALAAVGGVAWGGHHYLTHSDRFRVRKVLTSRLGASPERAIQAVTRDFAGKNIFAANLTDMEHRLETLPWIKSAHAKRRIPDTLLIEIVERVPAVLVRIRENLYLADAEGVVLDRFGPEYADYDFPILTGLDRAGRDTLRLRINRGAAFVSYLTRNRPLLADQVSEINVGRDDSLEVRLNDGSPPLRVRPDAFGQNLDNYLAVRNYIAANYGDVRYVDLRWKDRISILPAGGRITDGSKQ